MDHSKFVNTTLTLSVFHQMSKSAAVKLTPQTEIKSKIIGKLNDRSGLSNEMADLCVNLPIYRITEGDVGQSDTNDAVEDPAVFQVPEKRKLN